MVLKLPTPQNHTHSAFENDVKLYGTQALFGITINVLGFENDVKLYGTQAVAILCGTTAVFENDVKLYGTQAH